MAGDAALKDAATQHFRPATIDSAAAIRKLRRLTRE